MAGKIPALSARTRACASAIPAARDTAPAHAAFAVLPARPVTLHVLLTLLAFLLALLQMLAAGMAEFFLADEPAVAGNSAVNGHRAPNGTCRSGAAYCRDRWQ